MLNGIDEFPRYSANTTTFQTEYLAMNVAGTMQCVGNHFLYFTRKTSENPRCRMEVTSTVVLFSPTPKLSKLGFVLREHFNIHTDVLLALASFFNQSNKSAAASS